MSWRRRPLAGIPAGPAEGVDRESHFGRQRITLHELRLLPGEGVRAVREPRQLKKGGLRGVDDLAVIRREQCVMEVSGQRGVDVFLCQDAVAHGENV